MKRARRVWLSALAALGAAVLALAPLAGCAGDPKVVRVYDGRVLEGRFIPPEAYAAYLRGVLAEEAGDAKGALAAYGAALEADGDDPLVLARLGAVRCQRDPKDPRADAAFDRALAVDPAYAGALSARSQCELSRGRHDRAAALARRAEDADPASVTIGALLVRAYAGGRRAMAARARARAVELTLAHGERPEAWDALVAWGRAHDDAALVARGLAGLVRAEPSRAPEVERGALDLLGRGRLGRAREVAASLADAPAKLGVRPKDPTVARLAVDEALARGDRARAEARATRGRVGLEEVAGRALVLGQTDLAVAVAREVAAADGGASGAHMVLAAALARPGGRAEALVRVSDRPPSICALAFAERLAVASTTEVARGWLARIDREPMAPHDPLSGPIAVELSARGVLAPEELPPELRIELAARAGEPPPGLPLEAGAVDDKHELLWAALREPKGARARELLPRLTGAVDHDPVVAFAVTRLALEGHAAAAGVLERLRRAVSLSPADPLALAAAVQLAERTGRPEELAPARARLSAVARTNNERALSAP